MIKYSVQCPDEHSFEAWFPNSAAFDIQVKRGLVTCPACGSVRISKSLMAPNVSVKTRRKGSVLRGKVRDAVAPADPPGSSAPAPDTPRSVAVPSPSMPPAMLEIMRKIRQEVEAKAEYVGPRFADEARKMHYDEAPERGIYGEVSATEVKALHEEGIDCLPLPELPEDRH